MDGFERRKRIKMELIIGAAAELFFKYGFQKVSVNEIAQQAKVSPATIYNYFGTKEQLYRDTLVDWMDKQLAQYEHILASDLPFPDKTKAILLLEAQNLKTLTDELPKLPAAERGSLMEMMETYSQQNILHFFEQYIALGKKEGFIRENQTKEMTLRYFTMFQRELASYWETAALGQPADRIDAWLELFFYGLAGKQ